MSLGRTDLLSSNRHFASAPVEDFLSRWEQPNKRNRSYELRSGADPIAGHDYLPAATHPPPRVARRPDRRKLPPSRYGSDDHHVPQILQQEWNGTTSFALDKLHDFRQSARPASPSERAERARLALSTFHTTAGTRRPSSPSGPRRRRRGPTL